MNSQVSLINLYGPGNKTTAEYITGHIMYNNSLHKTYMWQSRVDIIRPSYQIQSAVVPLRAGLICVAKKHEYLISLHSGYKPGKFCATAL